MKNTLGSYPEVLEEVDVWDKLDVLILSNQYLIMH